MSSEVEKITVGVALKNASHPWFNLGFDATYVIDGVPFAQLNLVLDRTYRFMIGAPSHPFYFTEGAMGAGEPSAMNKEPQDNGVFEFLPQRDLNASLVAQIQSQRGTGTITGLFYQCIVHPAMGGVVRILNPEDVPPSLKTVERVDPTVLAAVARHVRVQEKIIDASALASAVTTTAPVTASNVKKLPKGRAILNITGILSGLQSPTAIAFADGDPTTMFVADQFGVVWGHDLTTDKTWKFLDVSRQVATLQINPAYDERGLLGLAFHPRTMNEEKKDRRVFIYYSTRAFLPDDIEAGYDHYGCLSDFPIIDVQQDADGDTTSSVPVADHRRERVLIRVRQPYRNHNGGSLAFLGDETLCLGLGDGGSQGDPARVGQRMDTMLGKIVRIDVNGSDPVRNKRYRIPNDNPWLGIQDAIPEGYASGLRNVWGMYYDRESDRLFAADVGYNKREEINLIVPGGNYGWSYLEGSEVFDRERKRQGQKYLLPILEYTHKKIGQRQPLAVIGGAIYRDYPDTYLFGDFNGMVFVAERRQDKWDVVQNFVLDDAMFLKTIGRAPNGTVYAGVTSTQGPHSRNGSQVVSLDIVVTNDDDDDGSVVMGVHTQ